MRDYFLVAFSAIVVIAAAFGFVYWTATPASNFVSAASWPDAPIKPKQSRITSEWIGYVGYCSIYYFRIDGGRQRYIATCGSGGVTELSQ